MRLPRWLMRRSRAPRPGDAAPRHQAVTEAHEAVRIAREWAQRNGAAWREPIQVDYVQGEDGHRLWTVRTHVGGRGAALFIAIDDETGAIARTHRWPR
jgi:hypothetical protein